MFEYIYNIFIHELQDTSVYEASQDIAYLDNVIQESLRLYLPGPRFGN